MNKLQLACTAVAVLSSRMSTADPTALRPGLWELDFKSDLSLAQAKQLSARIPDVLFAKVPAAQRTEIERAYRSGELLRNALNGSNTLCLTEEHLEHGIQAVTEIDQSCSVAAAAAHQAWQQVHLLCTGLASEAQAKAVIDIAVQDANTFTGSIVRSIPGPKPFTIRVELHGQWLDTQCGEEALEEDEGSLQ